MKKTILIDLDGVLNQYDGNFKADYIPPIREGAAEFVEKLANKFDLKLFTTRDKELAKKWLESNDLEKYFTDVTNTKVPAVLLIDDRCIKFEGNYNETSNIVENFTPWWKL